MKKALGAALAASLCGQAALAQSPPTVSYITAKPQPVYQEQRYVGRIASPQIVQLQARISGFLEAQDFKDGAKVRKGELLYVIEQPPYQAQVEQAKAAVAQAQAQARNANLALNRARALLHTAAGQQSLVDAAEATALSDQAAVLSAEAQLQTAQINLGYTEIKAPIDGVIGATAVTPGNVVGPTSGVLDTIVSTEPMYIDFSLPAVDAIRDRPREAQLSVQVQLPDGSTYGQTGHLDFIDNRITQNTDTLNWRATIANPEGALTDGEFVTVLLRDSQPKSALVLPLAALVTDQLGDYVLEVGPGDVVTRHNVTLGQQTNTTVVVKSGVSPGDKVITEGIQRIHPGLKITPRPEQG
ncbi:MAG: hypothetical protein B7Z80_05620 [Rhodospirillales bacterium 20-64-7]|nr:MAG: hypothetical protein B7Z80_05620 [Rhodospirillales bacterium 20-64-7]